MRSGYPTAGCIVRRGCRSRRSRGCWGSRGMRLRRAGRQALRHLAGRRSRLHRSRLSRCWHPVSGATLSKVRRATPRPPIRRSSPLALGMIPDSRCQTHRHARPLGTLPTPGVRMTAPARAGFVSDAQVQIHQQRTLRRNCWCPMLCSSAMCDGAIPNRSNTPPTRGARRGNARQTTRALRPCMIA